MNFALRLYHTFHDDHEARGIARTAATHAFLHPSSTMPIVDRVRAELGAFDTDASTRLRTAILSHARRLLSEPEATFDVDAFVGAAAYQRTIASPLCGMPRVGLGTEHVERAEILPMRAGPHPLTVFGTPQHVSAPRDSAIAGSFPDDRGAQLNRLARYSACRRSEDGLACAGFR